MKNMKSDTYKKIVDEVKKKGYEIDLLTIYEEDPEFLWKILSKLQISGSIKANLYNLMKNNEGECFEKHLEELNSSLYRDSLREDKLLLQRSVKK